MLLPETVWNLVENVAQRTDYFYILHASALSGLVLSACVAYHLVAEPLLLLDVSTSQSQHLQLTGAALAGQTFDKHSLTMPR